MALASFRDLCIDAADPVALGGFWGAVLGREVVPLDDGGVVLRGARPTEAKVVKNRIHWDVTCDDVPALVARGATVLREPVATMSWHVLADPQGNEFCAFSSV